MNTSINADEKLDIEAVMTEIDELKSSGEWPKEASASTIAYLTSIGQWPMEPPESTTVATSGASPTNDSCGSATPIEIASLPILSSGDTSHASTEPGIGFCGTKYENAPAVWYKVKGIGGVMSAETLLPFGYDTKLHVYSGSCGTLNCIDGNDCGGEGCLSKVVWDSVDGEDYFIMVHGYNGQSGLYNLEVKEILPPPNDSCASATQISTLPFSSFGVTTDATTETGVALSNCATDYEDGPAVWYKVTGTGGVMKAETVKPSHDTKLHVYSGSCGDFTCIDGNDDADFCSFLSKVTWNSVLGEDYFILVHGYDDDEFGPYNLEVISGICAELDGRCKLDCEDDEDFVCVPGLCSYNRDWYKPTKSPKMRELKEEEVDVVDLETTAITAEGSVERKLKAIKTTSKAKKATKAPKSCCECSVPRKRGCDSGSSKSKCSKKRRR